MTEQPKNLILYMINQGKLEEIEKPIFTTGDSYIVVDKMAQKVYIWLGSKCSVDEKGTAAIQARAIDDGEMFHGNAKIITYDEGMEDAEFLAKLGSLGSLKVLDKNLAKTMLKDVKTGEFAGQESHVDALYKISSEEFQGGVDAIKFVQVPFEKASLDPDDCFVADMGTDIWIWQGSKCNVKEKTKALQIAREFDATRAGSQKPRIFEEGDDAEFLGIFEGKKPKQDRETVDLKAEAFEGDQKKEEPKPAEPAPKKEEPKPAEPAPKKEEPKPAEPAPKQEIMASHAPAPVKAAGGPPSAATQQILIQKGSGRLQCPKCGNVVPNMIRTVEDHTHKIMDYPVMYGKKHVCGKCGSHWRREE